MPEEGKLDIPNHRIQTYNKLVHGLELPYRRLFLLGLYFRYKAKAPKLIPLKFLLQYKSYGE